MALYPVLLVPALVLAMAGLGYAGLAYTERRLKVRKPAAPGRSSDVADAA